MLNPTMDEISKHFQDVTGAASVEVLTDSKGILWVNVNGICLLRICQIGELYVNYELIKHAGLS